MNLKIKLTLYLILGALAFALPITARAAEGNPGVNCPPGFELHHYMEHEGEHKHPHIGVDRDLNGDGLICMKVLPNGMHLHVDNAVHGH